MDFTLRKKEKLHTRAEFEQIRRDGRKFVGRGFLLVVAPSPDSIRKCGVICSRKYSKLAVHRNRARRLLFEGFRLTKPKIAVCRLLMIPRWGMKNYRLQDVLAELEKLLRESGVYASGAEDAPPRC